MTNSDIHSLVKKDRRHTDMTLYHGIIFYFGLIEDGLKGTEALDMAAYFTGAARSEMKLSIYGPEEEFAHI